MKVICHSNYNGYIKIRLEKTNNKKERNYTKEKNKERDFLVQCF